METIKVRCQSEILKARYGAYRVVDVELCYVFCGAETKVIAKTPLAIRKGCKLIGCYTPCGGGMWEQVHVK